MAEKRIRMSTGIKIVDVYSSGKPALIRNGASGLPHACRQILFSRRGLFEGHRTDAAEMIVVPGPVVEHFNLIEDIRPGQIPGFI